MTRGKVFYRPLGLRKREFFFGKFEFFFLEGIFRVLKGFCLEEGEKTKRNESKLSIFQGRTDHIFG